MQFEECKTGKDIRVIVADVRYCVPWFCLSDVLWGKPDIFYPCNKYEWADHPLYFTSIEMLKAAIIEDPSKFKAFIVYGTEIIEVCNYLEARSELE